MENNNNQNFGIIVLILFLSPFLIMFIMMFMPGLNLITISLIILGAIITWAILKYNKFVSLKEKIRQASSGIDVYLKQRFDLIPNLVETVKGYKTHEANIMENIATLRSDYEQRNVNDILQCATLNDRYTGILVLLENYPELKSSEAFLDLQKTLSKIESQLQAARRIYNAEVTEYNIIRCKFPSNLIALIFKFNEEPLFEIRNIEKENINISM